MIAMFNQNKTPDFAMIVGVQCKTMYLTRGNLMDENGISQAGKQVNGEA
jgi:hypothetical protein